MKSGKNSHTVKNRFPVTLIVQENSLESLSNANFQSFKVSNVFVKYQKLTQKPFIAIQKSCNRVLGPVLSLDICLFIPPTLQGHSAKTAQETYPDIASGASYGSYKTKK